MGLACKQGDHCAGRYSLAVPPLPLPPGRMPKAEVKDFQSGREIVGTNRRQLFSMPLPDFSWASNSVAWGLTLASG